MAEPMEPGRTHRIERAVVADLTADRFGNPGVAVFATPALIALLEETAIACVTPALEPGQGTVGSRVDVTHMAPTPEGLTVTATATLREVDGRRLVFDVEAHDDREQIAQGTHERFVVGSMERFLARAAEKAQS